MRFIEDLIPLRLYPASKKLFIPIDLKNKKKGSAIILLSPTSAESQVMANLPYVYNPNYFNSYYISRDVTAYIDDGKLEMEAEDDTEEAVQESFYYTNGRDKIEMEFDKSVSSATKRKVEVALNTENWFKETVKTIKMNDIGKIDFTIYEHRSYEEIQKYTGKKGIHGYADADSVRIVSESNYTDEDGEYENYIKHEIVSMLLHNINPDINPVICAFVSGYFSGQYKDKKVAHTNTVNGSKTLADLIKAKGYGPVRTMIRTNDIGIIANFAGRNVASKFMKLFEASMPAKERNALPDSEFGIPSQRKYPLNDEAHVRAAIKMFNHVDSAHEEELARRIKSKMKKFGIDDVEVGSSNKFSKYYTNKKKQSSKKESVIIPLTEALGNKVDFRDIKRIVDNLTPQEKKWLYHGDTFKDSPYVVYRNLKYLKGIRGSIGGFLEAYIFPREEQNIYISIAVEKQARGKGIADDLVTEFMQVAKLNYPNKTVIWKVNEDNIASIKLAKRHGFTRNKDGDYIYHLSGSAIGESSLKSTLDPNFKAKGHKSLSNFKKVKIDKTFVDKNKDEAKFLRHIKLDNSVTSYAWLDKNGTIAAIASVEYDHPEKGCNWIEAVEVTKPYKGYGLGTQLVNYAVSSMKGNALTVAMDNEIAKRMYEKAGFKISKDSEAEVKAGIRKVYFMYKGFTPSNAIKEADEYQEKPKVYFTKEITPESLVKIYNALGKPLYGRTLVKLSTGEPGGHNFLNPTLIKDLVDEVHGTIGDANTAYEGKRQHTDSHYKVMDDHGFSAIAPVDVLDAEGDKEIPIKNHNVISKVYIGSHMDNYDSFLVLSHFKGHAMAGFGGAIKNVGIGMASARGKSYVHTGGRAETGFEGDHETFLKSLADSANGIMDYMGDNVVYINIANNISVDCDCDAHPADPCMADIGIFASTDPLAVDKACIDAIKNAPNNEELIERINRQTGLNTLAYSNNIGMGSLEYDLVDIDSYDIIPKTESHMAPGWDNEDFKNNRYCITEDFMRVDTGSSDFITFFTEDNNTSYLRRYLYKERLKNSAAVANMYRNVKESNPWIRKTFPKIGMYAGNNVFVDVSYYNGLFIQNNIRRMDKGVELYWDFVNRLINNKEIDDIYGKKTIFIPVDRYTWGTGNVDDFVNYKVNLNPISMIFRMMKTHPELIAREWGNKTFLFVGKRGYFTIDFSTFKFANLARIKHHLTKLFSDTEPIIDDENPKDSMTPDEDSSAVIAAKVTEKINNKLGTDIPLTAVSKSYVDNLPIDKAEDLVFYHTNKVKIPEHEKNYIAILGTDSNVGLARVIPKLQTEREIDSYVKPKE